MTNQVLLSVCWKYPAGGIRLVRQPIWRRPRSVEVDQAIPFMQQYDFQSQWEHEVA